MSVSYSSGPADSASKSSKSLPRARQFFPSYSIVRVLTLTAFEAVMKNLTVPLIREIRYFS